VLRGAARPSNLEPYFKKWNLTAERQPIRTVSGWVAFVQQSCTPCVLKIPIVADEINSSTILEAYRGNGAVRLLAYDVSGAQLLERAVPGSPLTELVFAARDVEATAIICDVAGKLHCAVPPPDLPTVNEQGKGFERYASIDAQVIPCALLTRAKEMFFELSCSQARPVLLHGDLHHDNIVIDEQRGWLAIDPKGLIGEPEYEFGAMLRNPTGGPALFADASIILSRVEIISERLALNKDRILAWAFAQGILSAIWAIEDGQDPNSGLACAEAILPLL